jgi:hypothetical protein
MSTLIETRQSPHDKLKNQIANDYRAKGYVVTTEKCIGNRRVDIYAENDKESLIIEVVDTHYSGPLDEKLWAQLKVTLANGHGKTTKILQSFGEETFLILENEAKKRDIKVQELIRTVIVPEWLKKEGLR